MKKTLILTKFSLEYSTSNCYDFNLYDKDNLSIIIDADFNKKFIDLFSDYDKILASFENNAEELRNFRLSNIGEINTKELEQFDNQNQMIRNEILRKKLFEEADEIVFYDTDEGIEKYIRDNPIIMEKKIIINLIEEADGLDYGKMISLREKFKGLENNIYLKTNNNSEVIKFSDYCKTVILLDEIVKNVKKLDLSPMEEIMLVYDIVRDREYVSEDENESESISRDLTSVLFGDKIVCLGYANIMQAILKRLGYNSTINYLNEVNDATRGHARCSVYVKDPKYNIEGAYFFDPTFDCKKKNENFLNSYKYFALSLGQMNRYDNGYLYDESIVSKNLYSVLDEYIDNNSEIEEKDINRSILYLAKILDGELNSRRILLKITRSRDVKYEICSKVVDMYNKPLTANILFKILYNVRVKLHEIDPYKYSISEDDFCITGYNSNWKFEQTREQILLQVIFGEKIENFYDKYLNDFKTFIEKEKLFMVNEKTKSLGGNKDA